jgi:hypothetical protein
LPDVGTGRVFLIEDRDLGQPEDVRNSHRRMFGAGRGAPDRFAGAVGLWG